MILGIEVLCEACGIELEITDVTTDCLLRVTLKARPCSKCSRPPDCHLSCEDILDKEKELAAFREQITKLEKKLKILSSIPVEVNADDEDFDDKKTKPTCFGDHKHIWLTVPGSCDGCEWLSVCEKIKK